MEDRTDQQNMLMEVNNLKYTFDSPLSVSVNRTQKKQFFATRDYTNTSGTAVCDFNSGSDLLDCKRSWLKLRIRVDAADGLGRYSFGSGSAMNLFREVKILHHSGQELARTTDANVFHKFTSRSKHPTAWFNTVGVTMGSGGTIYNTNTIYDICIPLLELDPFFELYDDKLLPATVASGMRVELTLEDFRTVFFQSAGHTASGVATGYSILGMEFRTEHVTLMDSAMAQLNYEASKSGLELTYDRIFSTSQPIGTNTSDHLEIRKAVALAKQAWFVQLPTANRQSLAADSFQADAFTYTELSSRIGNLNFPYQPIENATEAYLYHLKNYGKLDRNDNDTAITLASYIGTEGAVSFNFERSDSLQLSSIPVNQSRVCELSFTRSGNTNVKMYAFLVHTALARSSLTNVSVKV